VVAVAVALYLLPVLALFVARARRDRPLWEIAVDLPLAVAADMMLLLLVSRVTALENAAFVTRVIELAAAAGWILRRRRRGDGLAWPSLLGGRAIGAALASAAAFTLISVAISRSYQVWDRFWHISLVSTIRTQTLPFANVYDPSRPLSYHYSGDAMAAALQALSGLSLHSSHALSLTHDLMFAIAGAAVGLLLVDWGVRGWSVAAAGAVTWVLAGPPSLLRDDEKQWAGYNFVHYLTLSYRPHVSVAGLFVVGIVGSLAARVGVAERRPDADRWLSTAVPLAVITSALSVTDEASCAVLGLTIGVGWLVWPELLGPSRKHGMAVLASLAVGLVLANLLFAGLLAPGAERPGMNLVAWRSPGFANPTLPFTTPGGSAHFFRDVAALLTFAAAFALAALRARKRPAAAVAAMALTLVGIAVFALGKLNIPPKPVEAHRFVTAGMLACPLLALFALSPHGLRDRSRAGLVEVLFGLAIVLPAASTFAWLWSPGKTAFQTQASFAPTEDFFRTSCSRELGVAFGESPRPTYASKSVLFVYSGCHPTFLAGKSGGHKIRTSAPLHAFDALAEMRRTMRGRGDESIDAICPANAGNDAICRAAIDAGPCAKVGKTRGGIEIVRCTLTAAQQDELLARQPRRDAKGPPPASKAEPADGDDGPDAETKP
jgi:hypothetical protein